MAAERDAFSHRACAPLMAVPRSRLHERHYQPAQRVASKNKMEAHDFFTEYGEANRYTIKEVIGKGSYGVVCSALDTKTGEKVAIKKINNVFDHVSDATRILREIKLLRLLRHPGERGRATGGCNPRAAGPSCAPCRGKDAYFSGCRQRTDRALCVTQISWRSSTSCSRPARGSSKTSLWSSS